MTIRRQVGLIESTAIKCSIKIENSRRSADRDLISDDYVATVTDANRLILISNVDESLEPWGGTAPLQRRIVGRDQWIGCRQVCRRQIRWWK